MRRSRRLSVISSTLRVESAAGRVILFISASGFVAFYHARWIGTKPVPLVQIGLAGSAIDAAGHGS